MKRTQTFKMILSAMFISLGYVLPFFTGQIKEIGAMLCPMHIPVILCGFICGWPWGLAVGVIAPLLRSLTLSMPVLFPSAVCMAAELAVYGAVSGIMYKILPRKKPYIYCSLLIAMLMGRIVWGIAMLLCLNINGRGFTFSAFIAGAFTNAVPGIIVQIVVIPLIVMILEKQKFRRT